MLVLTVPDELSRDWIHRHFRGLLNAAVRDITGENHPLELRVAAEAEPDTRARSERRRPSHGPAPSGAPRRPESGGFKAKYTFDSFVIGSSNRFAHAAALAVAEAPAQAYNPLFIYGSTGLGKTHLLARRRAVRQRALVVALRSLRHERGVRQRLHQLAPRQVAHRGLQAALPHVRPAAHRRRPVLRGQGALPGGVLPHVQLPLRVRLADRSLVGSPAARHRDARGAATQPLRVGPDHRHPATGSRDAHRDPAAQGEGRRDQHPRRAGADVHRRAVSRRTSASSKVRSPASSRSRRSPAGR